MGAGWCRWWRAPAQPGALVWPGEISGAMVELRASRVFIGPCDLCGRNNCGGHPVSEVLSIPVNLRETPKP